MKSKKAQEYLLKVVAPTAFMYAENLGECELKLGEAKRAIWLAEQETEERVRDKAIEAFCKDCPLYNHAGNCPDCSALNAFKQRLNEE
ncbi:hypothetical protein [Alistipes putredinis]|uniref:hypothetical protein n=1 Tax=Alistipes putredinis TaxID=28117 RepID=UPI003F7BD02E